MKEIGTALAVLAIYVLTLLLPLHQAAGLQRDLAQLGFGTTGNWSICATPAHDEGGPSTLPIKCPAAGIGKYEFAALPPPAVDIVAPVAVALAGHPAADLVWPARRHDHFGQSRAPPAAV